VLQSVLRRRPLLFAFCVVVAGCSFEPSRYPVSGVVTLDGTQAALTVVRFQPANGNKDPRRAGMGVTDATGRFTIGESGKNTGLPTGEYKVTFSQTLVNGRPVFGSGGKASERLVGEAEAVPEAYRNPATTPVTAQVGSSGGNFSFDIKRP
jgi:hypothetical protein